MTAAGQTYASGIGGGYQGAGTGIAVSGGLVSAKGGEYGGSVVGNGHNVAEAADVTINGGAFADKLPEGAEASDKVYGVVLGEDHIAAANVVERVRDRLSGVEHFPAPIDERDLRAAALEQ